MKPCRQLSEQIIPRKALKVQLFLTLANCSLTCTVVAYRCSRWRTGSCAGEGLLLTSLLVFTEAVFYSIVQNSINFIETIVWCIRRLTPFCGAYRSETMASNTRDELLTRLLVPTTNCGAADGEQRHIRLL